MVEHYTKQVNQKTLAAAAVLKWDAAGSQSGTSPSGEAAGS
jgi:hypothetical protein